MMSRTLPPLNGLRAFEAAARLGSFAAAALELGVTPAAVSQQIKALEHHLGRRLFHRHSKGLVLTDAGQTALPAVAAGFEELAVAGSLWREGPQRSHLTLSALPSVAEKWLLPTLTPYLGQRPELRVSLRVEEDPVDFAGSGIDLRICYDSFYYPHMTVEAFWSDHLVPLCSPDYLGREGPLERPEDLLGRCLIHTDWGPAFASLPTWADWFRRVGLERVPAAGEGHRVDQSSLALSLAAAGAGVVLGQGLLARTDRLAGRLISPFGPCLPLKAPYCLAYPTGRAEGPEFKRFLSWLKAEVAATLVGGAAP